MDLNDPRQQQPPIKLKTKNKQQQHKQPYKQQQ